MHPTIDDYTNDYDSSSSDLVKLKGENFLLYDNEHTKWIKDNLVIDWINNGFKTELQCPFCYENLSFFDYEIKDNYEEGEITGGPDYQILRIWNCFKCGYWKMNWYERSFLVDPMGGSLDYDHLALFFISKLKSFQENLPKEINDELASYIIRNPGSWNRMNPFKLEKLIASIFKMNYNDCEIIHVGKPFDGGIDVIFIESNGKKWLIQVKRRINKKSEGVETIRNLLGTLLSNNELNGIVVSTVDHFTYSAYKEVRNVRQYGYTVKLYDKGKLNRMVGNIVKYDSWLDIIKDCDYTAGKVIGEEFKRKFFDYKYQLRLPFNEGS